MQDRVVFTEEALMPTNLPSRNATEARTGVPRPVLIALLLLYIAAAAAMLHGLDIAAPDVLLASAP